MEMENKLIEIKMVKIKKIKGKDSKKLVKKFLY